jgi:hypothetical protein
MPVQVADVGQEWPTYSRIDKPIANGRGSQDVTNTALKTDGPFLKGTVGGAYSIENANSA